MYAIRSYYAFHVMMEFVQKGSRVLTAVAQDLCRTLAERGACFFADLVRHTGHLPTEIEDGLWELVSAGMVTADGFDNLRALIDPHRRRAVGHERIRRPRHAAGRWSLLRRHETRSYNFV